MPYALPFARKGLAEASEEAASRDSYDVADNWLFGAAWSEELLLGGTHGFRECWHATDCGHVDLQRLQDQIDRRSASAEVSGPGQGLTWCDSIVSFRGDSFRLRRKVVPPTLGGRVSFRRTPKPRGATNSAVLQPFSWVNYPFPFKRYISKTRSRHGWQTGVTSEACTTTARCGGVAGLIASGLS